MLTEFPASYHSGEDIHEQSDIDEVSLEADVCNIANPDLIAARDVKRLNAIPPRMHTISGVGRLTSAFNSNTEVLGFHQSGNTAIPNGVSLIHQ